MWVLLFVKQQESWSRHALHATGPYAEHDIHLFKQPHHFHYSFLIVIINILVTPYFSRSLIFILWENKMDSNLNSKSSLSTDLNALPSDWICPAFLLLPGTIIEYLLQVWTHKQAHTHAKFKSTEFVEKWSPMSQSGGQSHKVAVTLRLKPQWSVI